MRISRPCYDKMHRCPGWAGGGMRSARVDRCENGFLDGGPSLYEGRLWWLRFNQHRECGVLVLPHAVRWLDWRWWAWWAPFRYRDWQYNRQRRR